MIRHGNRDLLRVYLIRSLIVGVVCVAVAGHALSAIGASLSKLSSNGTSIEIIDSAENGDIVDFIPIFQSGKMKYFSVGVGKLERELTYPSFPLKIVFSEVGGAYLSLIAVTVWAEDGTYVGQIPGSHVKGPWVFIDLPSGKYRIKAIKGVTEKIHDSITLTTNKQRTLSFVWP